MALELERQGLPTVIVCTLEGIARNLGCGRCMPAVAIPHPLGDPARSPEEERALRLDMTRSALRLLLRN